MTRSQSVDFSAIHGLRQRDAKVKEIFLTATLRSFVIDQSFMYQSTYMESFLKLSR